MNIGWIKLHRSLLEWEWYDDINARILLIHLLISVNYEDKKWKGVIVKKGSMILSWQTLSSGCGLSIKKCRTAMSKLETSGEVARVAANKWQVVSLVKWDELQQIEEHPGKQVGKQRASKGQRKGKQRATTKEDNNIIKEEDNKLRNIPLSEIDISDVESKDHDYFQIAKAFQKLFIKNLMENQSPTTHQKNAKFHAYLNPIRLMIEKDEVSKEQLTNVWTFLGSNDGDFWKSNILSTSKLREKFSQLIIQANQYKNGNRNNGKNGTTTTDFGKVLSGIDALYGD